MFAYELVKCIRVDFSGQSHIRHFKKAKLPIHFPHEGKLLDEGIGEGDSDFRPCFVKDPL